jgi:hypothetical protein
LQAKPWVQTPVPQKRKKIEDFGDLVEKLHVNTIVFKRPCACERERVCLF